MIDNPDCRILKKENSRFPEKNGSKVFTFLLIWCKIKVKSRMLKNFGGLSWKKTSGMQEAS